MSCIHALFLFLTASFSAIDIDHHSQQCFNTFIASKDQDFVHACKLLVNCGDDLTQLNKLLKAVSILFFSLFHTIQCHLLYSCRPPAIAHIPTIQARSFPILSNSSNATASIPSRSRSQSTKASSDSTMRILPDSSFPLMTKARLI